MQQSDSIQRPLFRSRLLHPLFEVNNLVRLLVSEPKDSAKRTIFSAIDSLIYLKLFPFHDGFLGVILNEGRGVGFGPLDEK